MVQQYLDHSKAILINPRTNFKKGSKGSKLISLFGSQNEYDLREGFPLLTTKEMKYKGIIHELIWFMKGDTNIKYLEDNKVGIWRRDAFQHNLPGMIDTGIFPKGIPKYSNDWEGALKAYGNMIRDNKNGFAEKWGDAGPIYGKQWRAWEYYDKEKGKFIQIDQLQNMIDGLKKKKTGKKHIVNAWQPGDVSKMSLPPCHTMYQATASEDGNLEVQLYQRSCDEFLGVPYNMASYALLTQIIAQEAGLNAKTFIHTFGDAHFYSGLTEKGKWYEENFKEFQKRVKNVSHKEEFLEVLEWINKKAPQIENENKYDHVTAILEQLSRTPKQLPQVEIANKPFDQLEFEDFKIIDYSFEPRIIRKMAV